MIGQMLSMLGLAKKAGRVEIGEEPVGAAARAKKARVILVAQDAGPSSQRRAFSFAETGACLCLTVPADKDALGRSLGRTSVAMCAVTEIGFAGAVVKKLAAMDPERYGAAAAQLDGKAQRAMERRAEQLLRPALHGPLGLSVQLCRRRAVALRIHGGQLFHHRPGKADLRHGAHGHAGAAQRPAQRVLIRRDSQAQARTRLGKGESPALRGGAGILRHQDHPRLFGPGGSAHRFLSDLHPACLFGKAQHGQHLSDHPSPPPICASSAS